jgi:hypothetical protein
LADLLGVGYPRTAEVAATVVIEPTRLAAAWLLVVALAASAPVVGWCATARHQGQLLHPLFDHSHHVEETDHAGPGHLASSDHSHVRSGTSWSATSILGSVGWMAGVDALPPLRPQIVSSDTGEAAALREIRPSEYLTHPLSPPPRSIG